MLFQIRRDAEVLDSIATALPQIWRCACSSVNHIPIQQRPLELSIFRDNPDKFTLIGYSFDFPDGEKYPDLRRFKAGKGNTPSKHEKCSITAEQPDGVLVHDCDMRGGASGGPILGWINNKPYIVAINSAELANQRTGIGPENYATNVARVEEWLKQQGQTKK